jgi:hypothetical protein
MKKPRRILVTIELETTMTVAQIRRADRIAIGSSQGETSVWLYRHPPSVGDVSHRLVQVQANAVTPKAPVYGLPDVRMRSLFTGKAKRGRK